MDPEIDVVLVSYNSRRCLRASVEPLASLERVNVIVVDNCSSDGSLEAVRDLRVTAIQLGANHGFPFGCNRGIESGQAPFVLLLNPDARIDKGSLQLLAGVLEREPRLGAAAPKIVDADDRLEFSQRRFPRLRSTYARALFLHRLLPRATWTDEVVRDESVYARPGSPDWVSGACIMLRRTALAELGGLDEAFFMYCEDLDLCRRLRVAGYEIRYEPGAIAMHEGGASAPRARLLPVLAASRIRYARGHSRPLAAALERLGIALESLLRLMVSSGAGARLGHARSLWASIAPGRRAS